MKAARRLVGTAPVDDVTMEQAVEHILTAVARPLASCRPLLIMGPNAQLVSLAARNAHFREALAAADLTVADGISVVLAARLLGWHLHERVPGGELMEQLCAAGAERGLRVFFVGGLPGAARLAALHLQQRYPGLVIAGTCCPPMHFERSPELNRQVLDEIRAAAPDLVCVALGAPRQEIWMHRHAAELSAGAMLSVGAALDTQAGLRTRAPRWAQQANVEWLYRLVMEPRRLWRRYLFGNTHFLWIVASQWWRERITRTGAGAQLRY